MRLHRKKIMNPCFRSSLCASALCLLAALGCAPTNSKGSMAGQGAAPPADSVAYAFIPRHIANFPDYTSFRESGQVISEITDLDLALRECEFSTEEIGSADFPLLQRLSAVDSSLGAGDLGRLHFGTRRLLLILDLPSKGGPTAGTKTHDAVANTLMVAGKVGALLGGNTLGLTGGHFESTREYGHAYRAVYYDRAENRILFDTTSSITTVGQKAPGQKTQESYVKFHYRQLIEARLLAKRL